MNLMVKTYRITTLGCKVNQQESETLAAGFEKLSFVPARKGEPADICVINSCTVTSTADSKTRQRIRQARAANPEALVCVIGCLPEIAREAVEAMPEVDLVVGSLEKERAAALIMAAFAVEAPSAHCRCSTEDCVGEVFGNIRGSQCNSQSGSRLRADRRTRAMIKIEDGCDRFCSYCIVPYARGPVRSRPAEDVLSDAKELISAGYKELVLTGVNLALYGRDRLETQKEPSLLCSLVEQVCEIEVGIEYRVRLGSLEPTAISAEEAVRIAGIRGVCPQFHLSLQSGCEKTLKEMGRPYTPAGYTKIVQGLRALDPLFSITTDVIVGFPGESDEDFEESLEFVRSIGFSRAHVFKYSRRPGTRAAEMPGQVSETVKNERSRRMAEAAEESAARFLEKNKGVSRRTLIYGPDKSGRFIRGLTDNGIDVLLPKGTGDHTLNSLVSVTL